MSRYCRACHAVQCSSMHRPQNLARVISSRNTLQTCHWALDGQYKVLQEDQLAPTNPPLIAETRLPTIFLLASQLTVYTDGSVIAGARHGGAGVIVTCGDPADPIVLYCGRTSCRATRRGIGHHQPLWPLPFNLHRQPIATQGN